MAEMRAGLAQAQILLPLFLLALAGTAGAHQAQHLRTARNGGYSITHWTSEEGLPQNTVRCLLQSHEGYLWIGTRYGLARYDGVQFTDYTAELSELGADVLNVQGLAEDTEQRLWLQTSRGLVCYQEGRFLECPLANGPFQGRLKQIAAHPAGGLWVACTDGLLRLVKGRITECYGVGRELPNCGLGGTPEITRLVPDLQGRFGSAPRWG